MWEQYLFHTVLQWFFETEVVPNDVPIESECEVIYGSTVQHGLDGRCAVALSFKMDP